MFVKGLQNNSLFKTSLLIHQTNTTIKILALVQ